MRLPRSIRAHVSGASEASRDLPVAVVEKKGAKDFVLQGGVGAGRRFEVDESFEVTETSSEVEEAEAREVNREAMALGEDRD
ncbi:hypothetical protein HPP92_021042 [Vanilla planifolia]|uniref:Uncharacterized protein n=1 Tax=Vanilla planifolia TaxID=51239 RepID=A0A835PUW0_VANPL|nr:hypothetical protein HPP92_021042 [Vanilla planifolia]